MAQFSCLSPRLLHLKRTRSALAYAEHVPLNAFERSLLAVGSALAALNNPYRADMIATLSETTAGPSLPRMRDQMLESSSGRDILRERPRLKSSTIPLPELRCLPDGTFGRAYSDWLERCKVSPDTRDPVRYIDDPELAYVMQRYRECHDFYHVISGPFPVSVGAELVVKWFELANLGLPVAALSAIFGPLRLSAPARQRLRKAYLSWALKCGASAKPLITVYWEREWRTPLAELKSQLGIWNPPQSWAEFRASAQLERTIQTV